MKRREWLKKSIQASYGYEGAHMTWPIVRLTRQIFSFDEPKGGAVWVGRGIPRHWLTSGGPVGASGQDRLRSGFHRRALFGARRCGPWVAVSAVALLDMFFLLARREFADMMTP